MQIVDSYKKHGQLCKNYIDCIFIGDFVFKVVLTKGHKLWLIMSLQDRLKATQQAFIRWSTKLNSSLVSDSLNLYSLYPISYIRHAYLAYHLFQTNTTIYLILIYIHNWLYAQCQLPTLAPATQINQLQRARLKVYPSIIYQLSNVSQLCSAQPIIN